MSSLDDGILFQTATAAGEGRGVSNLSDGPARRAVIGQSALRFAM